MKDLPCCRSSVRSTELAGAFRLDPAAAVVTLACAVLGSVQPVRAQASEPVQAGAAVEFDTTFLRVDSNATVDVTRFAHGNAVSAGVYSVDLFINGIRVARHDVRFVAASEKTAARPCFSRQMLETLGVDFAKVAANNEAKAVTDAGATGECIDLAAAVPDATADFDFAEQKIALNVPQKYMRNVARGYVPPEMWQNGVNAAFLSYNANAYHSGGSGVESTQSYVGLNAGVNLGAWHFRHQSSVTQQGGAATQFDNIATYLQRDIITMKSQLTVGDGYTTGDVFDSVQFRGAQIATDDRMLPESLRGYAPIVRGTAESNARVTVRQNGQVIYETTVSPGPFEINDLYATGYGGNLDVTVTEANGRTKSFTVPYASVAQSLRPGTTRFSVTAGELRNSTLETNPNFAQFTLQRGLTNLVTVYGGAVAANGYMAADVGAALNTKFGALSADVTGAQTQIPDQGMSRGTSLRIGYSKFIDPTNTNIALAAYRYSTAGYMNLSDAASVRDLAMHGGDPDSVYRQRNRFQVTLNQNFKEYGTVFLNASAQQYWNRSGSDVFYQAGYNNRFKYGTYSISAGRTRNSNGSMSDQIMLSTTLPLGRDQYSPLLSTNLGSSGGNTNLQANVSGSLGERNQYSYSAYGAYGDGSGASTASAGASGTYRAPYAQLTGSASGGTGSSQVSAGISGSIVAHPGGVTFSQTVGDTFGVIEAPGAAGASVTSSPGVKLNGRGFAVVPYLTPYGINTVDIDPKGTSTDVEFESTSEQAVPRLGSVVMIKYKTVTGRAALIRAPQPGDKALPFGADVVDGNGKTVGIVAQDSRIFARGLEDKGSLFVKWGASASGQCRIDYMLPPQTGKAGAAYTSVEGHCVGETLTEKANLASGSTRQTNSKSN
ncbi:P pilus assembly protein, porin PapC [Burkholderia sp. Ch1-1]|uniref:P pilus assembly protein, porin PapC n=1 Tax=Paraburkholderia dioscoreae TaxID=2604047 RepID=A0A5Q4ZHM6_9BURK|nr:MULTISPECIES: fimbria/pilus outer membrane usher protein [Paraburkholderia]EIF35488.1 P pilus assembly protein, porin PapC [Burkholderia sp. Ch1-1]MDR8397367.1 fimbrial biogenesis outer membrane usher protein [Paraburkholderia sp. USG1]VVD31381.1 P pilus assembly protein, porin PapC [Paraburkholderia dioscoreae]